ncbi:mucin-22-like [Macrosteles quadrilineatus]|uniref:mucin-22-like n=1 Tax=Macrosteles quadrilineatus TaxID=74068 RepID=UPI0023E148DA|nr:mucin-22-like [Macrosteles quadrilineatus]
MMTAAAPVAAPVGAAAPSQPQGTRFMVQWEEHPMHLATRLGYLLEHQSLVDVTLMCNTHTLKVHRSVLAACSPYFESVLQRQLGNHPLIVLKDMKFCVLKSLIEFMYCGETSVTEENLNPLMEAAKFFEVKGLCTMSKEVLGGERPSPSKPVTSSTAINGATSGSIADIFPSTTYRGRGRRSGGARGRRNLATMLIPPPQGAPQSETAQIMLSLSNNSTSPTLQTTSRNVRISPNSRLGRSLQPASTILDSTNLLRNGSLTTTDLKALREQLNLEPRRRGRRRQTFGMGRGRIKDLSDTKFGIQNIKKEMEDVSHKDGLVCKPLESKLNVVNNNGNNDAQSPLLASLLSKAEALAKAKVKTENECDDGQTTEQETIMYQFDGESSGATKYLDALKEAGLPTDVPVLIDNGDGNYVTLTEDVLMNVLGNNEEFQFQVTEATLEQGDVSEGVVLQDGTIMMTGKNGKSDISGPLLTVSKKPITIKGVREVKGKRGPKQKHLIVKDMLAKKNTGIETSPQPKAVKKASNKKSVQELINEAVLESLKNGAASEAEADPDAVVLFEVTGNDKVNKYVVSSKEVNALKAMNEQMEKQKKLNSPTEKKCALSSTVIDGNTNIAEIKLTVPKNSRKSIVSEVLARAQSLESQVKGSLLNDVPDSSPSKSDEIKNEARSPQMLDMSITSDVLNDSSQLININSTSDNLENSTMIDLEEESQILGVDHSTAILDEENSMVVLNEENQIIELQKHHDTIHMSGNENLIVVNESVQDTNQEQVDSIEEPNEDSQLMQISEVSQEMGPEEASEGISVSADETDPATRRDMPLLENESQLVEFELIDGSGSKIKSYKAFTVDGNILSQKEISELSRLTDQNKDSDVIGLLDMVCEEAASNDIDSQVDDESANKEIMPSHNSVNPNITSLEPDCSSFKVVEAEKGCYNLVPVEKDFGQSTGNLLKYTVMSEKVDFEGDESTSFNASGTEHLVLEEVQNMNTASLNSTEMSLDGGECQELSVEQALQAMMGDENSTGIETQDFSQGDEEKIVNDEKPLTEDPSVHSTEGETSHNNVDTQKFEFVYETSENPVNEEAAISALNPLPETSTSDVLSNMIITKSEETSKEANENPTIVSPTKDVPFAVGLLPLKDALVQIQSTPDHQPRKTRSGSTSKPEVIGAKRRSSSENSSDGPSKRRKSFEDGDIPTTRNEEEESVT